MSQGDYDTAFISLVKFQSLSTDLLPNRHPGWAKIPEEIKLRLQRVRFSPAMQLDKKGQC